MKYLKRFNEELRPSTYMSAARKIKKTIGDTDRAGKLEDWARKMEMDESMIRWRENVKELSKYGTFKMNIKNPETGKVLTDDFYLDIGFDTLAMEDNYLSEKESSPDNFTAMFPFHIGIIPMNEETINKCEEMMPCAEFGNGFYWGSFFSIEFTVKGDDLTLTGFSLDNYDDSLSGDVSFADRASAGKFKNLIKKILLEKDLDYPSGYTDSKNLYEVLEKSILAECSMSSDYGLTLEQIAEYINTINPNTLYKVVK